MDERPGGGADDVAGLQLADEVVPEGEQPQGRTRVVNEVERRGGGGRADGQDGAGGALVVLAHHRRVPVGRLGGGRAEGRADDRRAGGTSEDCSAAQQEPSVERGRGWNHENGRDSPPRCVRDLGHEED